uniref:Uncharacterized protein n=1 Tax=Arundo donax TaxID=35708 RepID=A0A0A9F422_ARUDO
MQNRWNMTCSDFTSRIEVTRHKSLHQGAKEGSRNRKGGI